MKWVQDHRGSISLALVAIIAGVLLGLLLNAWYYDAEAVIGGVGNVTDGNNPHNLSSSATHGRTTSSETQICIFCHTPHHAIGGDASLLNAPLWNHSLSSATIDFSGTLSASVIINSTTMPSHLVDGASKLCMSCHDGTIGIGELARRTINMSGSCIDTDGSFKEGGSCSANLTTSPSHHTFSMPMNGIMLSDSLANCINSSPTTRLKYPWETTGDAANPNVLLRPTSQRYRSAYGISFNISNRPTSQYQVGYAYGVQCSTCHDPHLYRVVYNGTGNENAKFLVDAYPSNTTSLCTACHTTTGCP